MIQGKFSITLRFDKTVY